MKRYQTSLYSMGSADSFVSIDLDCLGLVRVLLVGGCFAQEIILRTVSEQSRKSKKQVVLILV